MNLILDINMILWLYRLDFRQIPAAKRVQIFKYFLGVPIPPPKGEQKRRCFLVKATADDFCGIPPDDVIGGHVLCYERIGADDRPVADVHAGHNGRILPDPDVVADDGIPFQGQIGKGRRGFFPAAAHDIEGIGRRRTQAVIGAVHDEFDTPRDGAEFADDQFVAEKRIVMGNVPLEIFRPFRIVVIGVSAHFDTGTGDNVFDETDARHGRIGNDGVGIGTAARQRQFLLMHENFPPSVQMKLPDENGRLRTKTVTHKKQTRRPSGGAVCIRSKGHEQSADEDRSHTERRDVAHHDAEIFPRRVLPQPYLVHP